MSHHLRPLPVILAGALLIAAAVGAAMQSGSMMSGPIGVTVDGQRQQYAVPPMMMNGSVMVPMRSIFESLGAKVEWNGAQRRVTAMRGRTKVMLTTGSRRAMMDGKPMMLGAAPSMHQNTVMVPLRFVGEALGAKVEWDGARRMVMVHRGAMGMARGQGMMEEGMGRGAAAGQPQAKRPDPPAADRGKQVYADQGCAACHRINGQGGSIGPDLSHVGASRSKAWLKEKITNPKASKPDTAMPPYQMPAKDLDALVDYLAGLK